MGLLDSLFNPFGGGGGSSTSGINNGAKSTETTTVTNTSYSDSRSVTDAGSGIVGGWANNLVNDYSTLNARYDLADDHSLGSGAIWSAGPVTVTDRGAVEGAFGLAGELARLFGSQSSNSTSRALDTVDAGLSTVSDATRRALDFGGNSQDLAFAFGNDLARMFGQQINSGASRSLDSVDAAFSTAIAANRATTGQAFDLVDGAVTSALGFVKAGLDKVSAAQDAATGLVATAYADAKGRGSQTDTLLMLAVVGACVVAVAALRKG